MSVKSALVGVFGAAQLSAAIGSIILAAFISIYNKHTAIEMLMVFVAVCIVALVGVNSVAIFVALPLRLLYRKRIRGTVIVLMATSAGAIIYPSLDLIITGSWYIRNSETFSLLSNEFLRSMQIFALIGSLYGFIFGLFYYGIERICLIKQSVI